VPATVRDILLMIRAKDDASRALSGISGAMRRTAAQADAASARARAAAARAAAQQARLAGATRAQVAAITAQAHAYDQQAKSAEAAGRKQATLGKNLQNAGRIAEITGIAMIAAGGAAFYGFKKAVDAAGEWDRQVRLTFTQVDKKYKPSLQSLSDIGLRVSRDIAVPFETVQGALFDVFSSTEANLPQAEKLLAAFAKAAVAGQVDIQTASRATLGLMNTYKIPFEDVNEVLDIQFTLVREGIGTYQQWAEKIGNVTPSAARAGQSIETMGAALATATRQGMSASRASTSVARAFDAMSNPKTEANLKSIGVASRDAKGNFRPMVDVLADWRTQLEKMPKEDRVKNILETLKGAGGTIEARRFLQNILLTKGGLELFQDQIKTFAHTKGNFTDAYNEMADSVAAKSVLLHNSWMQVKLAVGQALMPAFLQVINGLKRMLDWFLNLPKSVQKTIAQFALWGAALLVFGGAITVLIGVLITFAGVIAIAGSAIVPVLLAFAGGALAIGVLVAALVGLGMAFVSAYNNSAGFRAFIQSIGGLLASVGGMIRAFAVAIAQLFNATVMPALRQVAAAIATYVLPPLTNLINFVKGTIIPALQTFGTAILARLKPALAELGGMIQTKVVPLIKLFGEWLQRNQSKIQMVIKVLAVLAAIIVGVVIVAIIALIHQISAIVAIVAGAVRVLGNLWNMLASLGANAFHIIANAVKSVINWFKNLVSSVRSSMSGAKAAIQAGVAAIKGAFSGAAGMLLSAGANIVQGLINGIRGRIGEAAHAAANLAKSVYDSAMHALGVHSPSTVFRDIGMNVVRGLTLGIKNGTTMKQLQTAMFNLTRDIQRSIKNAKLPTLKMPEIKVPKKLNAKQRKAFIAKAKKAWEEKQRKRDVKFEAEKAKKLGAWNKKLYNTTSQLNKLEYRRVGLQNKLAVAQKSVNNQIQARFDLSMKIREAVNASADITTLDDTQKENTRTMIVGLQERLKAAQTFQKNLRTLAAKGLDKDTIAQLAQQGVDAAGTTVATLAAGSKADIAAITKLQQEIRKIGANTGNTVASDLYTAGIKAGQGLIKGLQSQIAAITKQMTSIATALIIAIKKQLGIKSPSRVMQDIGVNTAKGYINGYKAHMNKNITGMARASLFSPEAQARVALGSAGRGALMNANVPSKHIEQHITIHTQEIDPRKNAAELGWFLAGRVG
jgi:TP901 family phage tail tape measure protein